MSEVDKLFNDLSEDEIAAYTARHDEEPHIVINADRSITIPPELKEIAVQFDHNIETVTFDCVRYWDGHDLSEMSIYINYKRPDNKVGSYIAENVRVDEDDDSIMHFEWTFSRHVTEIKGSLAFLVCAQETDEDGFETQHWNSHLNQDLFVREGMDCQASVVDQYPAIITQLLLRMSTVEELPPTVQVTDNADGSYMLTMTDINGTTTITLDKGATFTPTVSEEGDISWTNDKGLPNPPTVRIKGPKGETGDVINILTSGNVVFAIGSMAAWEAYTGDKTDVVFIPTDVPTIAAYLDGVQNAHRKDDVVTFAKTKGIMAGVPFDATVISSLTVISSEYKLRIYTDHDITKYNVVGYNGVLAYIESCEVASEYYDITVTLPTDVDWGALSVGEVISLRFYKAAPVHKSVEASYLKSGRPVTIDPDKQHRAIISKPGLYAFVVHNDAGDAQNYSGCISIPDLNTMVEHTISRYDTDTYFTEMYVRYYPNVNGTKYVLSCSSYVFEGSQKNQQVSKNAYFVDVRLIAEY